MKERNNSAITNLTKDPNVINNSTFIRRRLKDIRSSNRMTLIESKGLEIFANEKLRAIFIPVVVKFNTIKQQDDVFSIGDRNNTTFSQYNDTAIKTETYKKKYSENRNQRKYLHYFSHLLKTIEASYGHGVYTYFKYLNYFIKLNSFLFLVMLVGVITPYYICSNKLAYCDTISVAKESIADIISNDTIYFSDKMLHLEGFFYGSYYYQQLNKTYKFTQAYASCFFICVALILSFLMYRSSKISGRLIFYKESYFISHYLLSGFCFGDDFFRSKIKLKKINLELEIFAKRIENEMKASRPSKRYLYSIRSILNLMSILYYVLTVSFILLTVKYVDLKRKNKNITWWMNAYPSCILVLMRLTYQSLLRLIMKYEYYSPTHELIIYITRVIILHIISLFIILKQHFSNKNNNICWESRLGMDIVVYIIVGLVGYLLVQLIVIIISYMSKYINIKKREFIVSQGIISIFMDQAAVWICVFYCPWVTLIEFIKLAIIYITSYFMLKYFYTVNPLFYDYHILKYYCSRLLWALYIYYIIALGYSLNNLYSSSCGLFGQKRSLKNSLLKNVMSSILYSPAKFTGFEYFFSLGFGFLVLNILCIVTSEMIGKYKYYCLFFKQNEAHFKCVIEDNKILYSRLKDLENKTINFDIDEEEKLSDYRENPLNN